VAIRKVPERPVGLFDPSLLDVLQQDGYAINQLLGAFETGAFTPEFTFENEGDLSVAYTIQVGRYWRVGSLLHLSLILACTPTFTSASDDARIAGLPFTAADAGVDGFILACLLSGSSITWPTGRTSEHGFIEGGDGFLRIFGTGTGASTTAFQAAQFTTAQPVGVRIQGFYAIDAEHP
jgi:hypothetical protein